MNIADFLKKDISYWPTWLNATLLKMNIFGKLIYGPAYFKIRKEINKKNSEQLIIESINHAIKNVKYYRDRYDGIQINNIDEFKTKIGFIDKDEVMAHWEDFLVDDIDLKKCKIGTTGGTSGKPLKLVQPKNRYITESIFIHKVREKTNWKVGKVKAMIRNHRLPEGRNHLINPITKDFIFDAFRIDNDYAKYIYKTIKKNGIEFIHAYPSAVYQFFKLSEKQNLDLSFIKGCLLSSEGITDEQYRYFTEHLKVKINFTYGHSEKLILGVNENDNSHLLIEPLYGYFELLDKSNRPVNKIDEIGEMIGSTFHNKHMPLIRYKTGDYAEYGGLKIEDNIEKTILKKIYGRREKSLIYKVNGTTTSLTNLTVLGDFLNHIDGMQYVQDKKGYVTILIIKGKDYTVVDEEFILEHVGNAMGGSEFVNVKYVDELIIQENGKFLPIITNI